MSLTWLFFFFIAALTSFCGWNTYWAITWDYMRHSAVCRDTKSFKTVLVLNFIIKLTDVECWDCFISKVTVIAVIIWDACYKQCLVEFCLHITWKRHRLKDWFLGFKNQYRFFKMRINIFNPTLMIIVLKKPEYVFSNFVSALTCSTFLCLCT